MTVILIAVIVLALATSLYNNFKKQISSVSPAKCQIFEDMKFSTQEFYTLTENLIKEREIPSVQFSRIQHKMGGILSAKREYLRVQYHEYFFDICAAPFAKDFFVSWRQGDLRQVSIGKRDYKTFYEQDTELMFHEAIKLCLNRAIKQVMDEKGIRITSEGDVPLLN